MNFLEAVSDIGLHSSTRGSTRVPAWVESSWNEPERFAEALMAVHSGNSPVKIKSRAYIGYDFVFDILHRIDNPKRAAIRFAGHTGDTVLTYGDLSKKVSSTASYWLTRGVEPGARLTILLPFGEEYIVALLAALSIGAVSTFITPAENSITLSRLEASQRDYLVTESIYQRFVSCDDDVLPPVAWEAGEAAGQLHFFSYDTSSVVFSLLDYCVFREDGKPLDLSADAAYISALRDGKILLQLYPGVEFGAPFVDLKKYNPSLILAVLFCGGTWVEAPEKDVDWWLKQKLGSILVGREFRDRLLNADIQEKPLWGQLIRDSGDQDSLDLWQSFVLHRQFADVYHSVALWNSAMGGAFLWSVPVKSAASQGMFPAPGNLWALADPLDLKTESVIEYGVFTPLWKGQEISPQTASQALLSKHGTNWHIGAWIHGTRKGIRYPVEIVSEFIKKLAYDKNFLLCQVDLIYNLDKRFDLLFFQRGLTSQEEGAVSLDLRRVITSELGEECVPSRIKFIPVVTRNVDSNIDREWAFTQYRSGLLARMAKKNVFHTISGIRTLLRSSC
jgi:hypothetical protein